MAAPTQPLPQTSTVTAANPTPPTNVVANYQGTPPTPTGLAPAQAPDPEIGAQMWLFADPLNGTGKAEDEGTEVTTVVGNTTGHSTGTSLFTESPNTEHPSRTHVAPVGPELVTGGDFATATGWTLSGLATISTGTLNMGGGANSTGGCTAAATLTAGNYQFDFDVTVTDGTGTVTVIIGGTPLQVAGTQATGHFTGVVTTAAADQLLQLRCITAVICKLDNFSVKRMF